MTTTDKLVLSVAVLLPVTFAIWSDQPKPMRPSADTRNGGGAALATPLQPGTRHRITPPDDAPMICLDIVGPAAFRAAFRRTNVGGLFASEEGERLWRPLLAPAERIWREWDGRGEAFEATRRIILDYAGRIRVLWTVQPGEKNERDRWCGVFALEMDGHTDLTTLASDLAHPLLARTPRAPTERTVGEHAVRRLGDAGGDFVTIPMVIGGRLVAFFGEAGALERGMPRCLRALAMDVEPPTAPVSLHIDLTQLQGLAPMREDARIGKLLGLESLRSLDATVGPNGAHAQLEIKVAFGDGDRGLIAGFLPAVGTLPGLLARVPAAATPWLIVPLDVGAMFRAALQMAATTTAYRDGGVASVRQEMHDETGLYLDTELLDHLGGEVMVLGDLWQADDPDAFRRGEDPPLGACITFSLRDSVAFGMGLDKLLDYLKGHVNRFDSRAVDGVRITRLGTMFSTGMHMAVGEDLFAMAFGDEGVAQLEALVARGRRPAEQPLPAAVQRVRHLAPAGLNGVGLADLRAVLGGQVALLIELLDDALPRSMRFDLSVDATQEKLDRLLPLIEEYELQNLVTMTGHADRVWRLRLLW